MPLAVCATPIGNLEDVTARALRILQEVAIIAAEDTRRTAHLLGRYAITTPTTSLHAHNERDKTPRLVERLRSGDSIALVSDAGTPAISDPGQGLVAAAKAAGIRVESVPGASSVMAAISASGLPAAEFVFVGFPPNRSNDRSRWLRRIAADPRLVVFFEAPHRICRTLNELFHDHHWAALDLVVPGGRFSAHGGASGDFTPVGARADVTVTGIGEVQLKGADATRHVELALTESAAGRLRPVLGETYPLDRAADAHEAMENRTAAGKTLLEP